MVTTNPVVAVKRGHEETGLCPLLQLQELTSRLPESIVLTVAILLMYLLLLFALLFQLSHFVSDLYGVDVQRFQERSSHSSPNSKELSV